MILYPVILPLGERGRVQDRRINLDDTVVAVNDSTGPGTGAEGARVSVRKVSDNHQRDVS